MGRIQDWWRGETRAADEPQHDPSSAVTTPPRERIDTLSTSDALGLVAVYRAVSVRVTAIRQLSLDIWRNTEKLDLPLFIRRPDIDTSYRVFIEQTVASLNLDGNAYWRIRRNTDKSIRSLEVLNPNDTVIRTATSGRVTGYSYRGYDLPTDQIKHLSRLRVPGTPYGLGPIQAAKSELRGAIDLRDYSAGWFRESGIPSGVLTSDLPLSAEQASDNRARWEESNGGRRRTAVLGSGLSYEPILLAPADAQFLESRQYSTTEIARLFGVPASLMLALVEGSAMTYQNVAQEWLGFVRFGLMDDLGEIEDAITDLIPRTQTARFNIEALLRSDTTTRYAGHRSGIEAGWLLPSEVREIEGYPAVAGIDERKKPPAPKETPNE